jgi:hypothetical protein
MRWSAAKTERTGARAAIAREKRILDVWLVKVGEEIEKSQK